MIKVLVLLLSLIQFQSDGKAREVLWLFETGFVSDGNVAPHNLFSLNNIFRLISFQASRSKEKLGSIYFTKNRAVSDFAVDKNAMRVVWRHTTCAWGTSPARLKHVGAPDYWGA